MPNASSADVRAGFDIYRENPEITLRQINAQLKKQGFGEIAERSIRHYRSLQNHGFDRYVSVNRFDVARASRPYEGASATPRYFYYGLEVPITMHFRRGAHEYEVKGVAERVGEVGAVLTFDNKKQLDVLRKQRPTVNTYIRLDFGSPVSDFATARVIESELDEEWALIEVEFSRLLPLSDLTKSTALPGELTTLSVVGTSPDDRAADLVGRRIYYTLEAIESCRAIANEVLRTESSSRNVVDPLELQSLSVQSPLVIVFSTPVAVPSVLLASWFVVRSAVKTGTKAYKDVQSGKVDGATAKKIGAEARLAEAEAEAKEIKNAAKRQEVVHREFLFGLAREELSQQVKLKEPELDESGEARRDSLTKQLLDNASSLDRQDVEGLEVTVGQKALTSQ